MSGRTESEEAAWQEARKFVDQMAQKHYSKQNYTKSEKARLKKINLRFRGEQVSIDAITLLHV